MKRFEYRIRSFDNAEIYVQCWPSAESARGCLIVTHGLAEHSDCYAAIIERWNLQHWDVIAWDLRGHGQSEGQRGYVRTFSDFTRDLHHVIADINTRTPLQKRPLVLFGHSMGGLISYSMAHGKSQWPIRAVALSSPLFAIAMELPWFKEKISGFLAQIAPRLTLGNEIDFNILTHDQAMIESYKLDSLRHEKISPSLYQAMVSQMQWAQESASTWSLPVLFQLAGDDRLVSTAKSEAVFARIPDTVKKHLVVYPGFYHEIYNEVGKERADEDLRKFLNQFVS